MFVRHAAIACWLTSNSCRRATIAGSAAAKAGTGPTVSSDRHSMTVTKVVEGCGYIRRRFYAISLVRGELQDSVLCSFSPLRPLIQRRKELPSDGEFVRASRLGLYKHTSGLKVEV